MKYSQKALLPLLFLLASCLLLSACDLSNVSFETQSQNELAPSNTDDTVENSQATDIHTEVVQETSDPLPENTSQPITLADDTYDPEKEFDYLIHTLKTYLGHLKYESSGLENTYENKFDSAKESGKVLFVEFNPNAYYYVCAYSDSGHEYEFYDQCCIDRYTWVKFEDEQELKDSYDGKDFVVSFQINKTLSCVNMLDEKDASADMEHYRIYSPEFVDGVNTSEPLEFAEAFLYFYSDNTVSKYHQCNNPAIIYHSTDCYYHQSVVLPLMELDNAYYVKIHTSTHTPDGNTSENGFLPEYFGKYYDDALRFMIAGKYNWTDRYGNVNEYGLLKAEDIAEIIKTKGD